MTRTDMNTRGARRHFEKDKTMKKKKKTQRKIKFEFPQKITIALPYMYMCVSYLW
jgi:hypothetical protein